MENVLAIVSLIITILFGCITVFQAIKYNNDTEKKNREFENLMSEQQRLVNKQIMMQRILMSELCKLQGKPVVTLKKDAVIMRKTDKFQHNKLEDIIQELRKLPIREKYIKSLETNFMASEESNEEEYCKDEIRWECVFESFDSINKFYEVQIQLLKYGIIIKADLHV